MLTLAQCEKAVTISEPMGRTRGGLADSIGSKVPLHLRMLLPRRRMRAALESLPLAFFYLVFNDLRHTAVLKSKRFTNISQYLQNRAFVLL
jgi:hypothetical protein